MYADTILLMQYKKNCYFWKVLTAKLDEDVHQIALFSWKHAYSEPILYQCALCNCMFIYNKTLFMCKNASPLHLF